MVRPLDLEELDGLVTSLPFHFIQDADRMLTVSQILLNVQHFMINPTNRIFEATTELRDMEHIMHIREFLWKLQLVGEITYLSQDSERTNKVRCQFPFYPETANPTEGRDMKVGFITNGIVNLLMILIIVALLPGLSSLEILSNDTDFLFSLIDHIMTEEWPLSGFGPV